MPSLPTGCAGWRVADAAARGGKGRNCQCAAGQAPAAAGRRHQLRPAPPRRRGDLGSSRSPADSRAGFPPGRILHGVAGLQLTRGIRVHPSGPLGDRRCPLPVTRRDPPQRACRHGRARGGTGGGAECDGYVSIHHDVRCCRPAARGDAALTAGLPAAAAGRIRRATGSESRPSRPSRTLIQ